jgi:hypothetical protein
MVFNNTKGSIRLKTHLLILATILLSACNAKVQTSDDRLPESEYSSCHSGGWDEVSFEPNNIKCQAYPIEINAEKPIKSAIKPQDLEDWFAINLSIGDTVTLEVKEQSVSNYSYNDVMKLDVIEPDGMAVIEAMRVEEQAQFFIDLKAKKQGLHWFRLYTDGKYGHGYSLQVFSKGLGLDQNGLTFEPNNTKQSAFEIVRSQQYLSQITDQDPVDVYELSVNPGQKIQIYLDELNQSSQGAYNRLYWSVVDDTGLAYVAQQSVDFGGSVAVELEIIESKKIYIQLYNASNNGVYRTVSHPYQLIVY